MRYEMGTDTDLLNGLVNSGDIVVDRLTGHKVALSRKQFAYWTARSVQTISDYGTGKHNIPLDFWRRILAHHFDQRILHLLIPDDVDVEVAFLNARPLSSPQEFFRHAIELEGAHHRTMMRITDILADGRVDELDAAAVKAYHASHCAHRDLDSTLHREIMRTFNQSTAHQEFAR